MWDSPRLADVLITLALATDLGMGRPLGSALRRCLDAMGAPGRDVTSEAAADIYYSSLLTDLGCTATTTERARRAGADLPPVTGRGARTWRQAEAEVSVRLGARLGIGEEVLRLLRTRTGTDAARSVAEEDARLEREPEDFEALRGAVLAADPSPDRLVNDLDAALAVISDFADLKSPFLLGHSRRVAALAAAAAEPAGIPEDSDLLRHAGLVHDIGRVGVSSFIWNKAETLEVEEMEQVRRHPFHTERLLEHSEIVGPLAGLASSHHECVDGSGYHKGASGDELTQAARLLAAADDLSALTELRPHRPAMDREQAERVLKHFVDSGCLDREAVDAVLSAVDAGALSTSRSEPEADLVRMAARGLSAAEIRKTLGWNRSKAKAEVKATYARFRVTNRAALAAVALEQGFFPE